MVPPKIAFQANSSHNSEIILRFMDEENIVYDLKNDPNEANYIFLFPLPFEEMLEWCNKYKNKILIFVGAESYVPDFNLFDYSFSYDVIDFGDRHLPIQFQALFCYHLSEKETRGNEILTSKQKFCNFIYSNPQAHPNRDLFFNQLNTYKKVDSLGKHLRNTEVEIGSRNNRDYFKESIRQKKPYKFSIAFENALHRGYNTEKIISSMESNTIPIYWGDPDIGKTYNSKSFVNCHEFSSFNAVVEYIKELDKNDALYLEKLNEPWRTREQENNFEQQKEQCISRLQHIFSQPFQEAFRKPIGTYNDFYVQSISKFNKTNIALKKSWKYIHHKAHLVKTALKK